MPAIPTTEPRYLSFGDSALLVEFGTEIDRAVSDRVTALAEAVAAVEIAGVTETAPSFRSLLVQFDPIVTDAAAVEAALREIVARGAASEPAPARRWRLPACYDPAFGEDLGEVAERAGLTVADVVERHAAVDHHVYMIGFLPGCPYMGDLPAELTFPRRKSPRVRIPGGTVAIAIGLTVIYPVESPGGWHMLARTPAPLFRVDHDPPALLAPGDLVRFEPIGRDRFDELAAAAAAGRWWPEAERSDRGGGQR